MARVPNTLSLEWLIGGSGGTDDEAQDLHRLPDHEVCHLIRQCASALKSHAGDFQRGRDRENALAAFESVMAVLLELRGGYPDKRADIDIVLSRFGYPVPEN